MAINPGILCQLFIITIFGVIILSILRVLLKSSKVFALWSQNHPNSTERVHTIEEPFNLVGMMILLLFELVVIQIKVGFDFNGTSGDLPGLLLAIIPVIIGFLFIGYNLYMYARGQKKEHRYGLENENHTISHKTMRTIDYKRKSWHFIAFILLSTFLLLGSINTTKNFVGSRDSAEFRTIIESFWGNSQGEGYLEIAFIRHSIPLGQTILIMVMYGMVMVLLVVEITRLSNFLHCVFHKETQKKLLYKEIDTFASYSHFAVGYLASAMVLPPMLFLAGLCLAAFADPAASMIGMKFGKKRYSWNQKSLEGTLGGSLAAFLTMSVFVGPIYSIIGAIVFAVLDLVTPKPVKVSDNLLMPICITFVFAMLSLLNIPSINVFGV
ncbi:hypothetical protein [Candidatus Lokiarchaeum ossiferum]|uniref:hypothetical protein n=1 Tax=Candidatus Lokiarchaeum ossiferum TaxID=2951803 RepID=UPI00352DD9D9